MDGTGSGGGVRMPSKEIDKPKGACTCSAAAGKVKSASGQTEGIGKKARCDRRGRWVQECGDIEGDE